MLTKKKPIFIGFLCFVPGNYIAGIFWPDYPDGLVLILTILVLNIVLNLWLLIARHNTHMNNRDIFRLKVELLCMSLIAATLLCMLLV